MTERKWTKGPWVAVRNSSFWELQPEGERDGRPYKIGDVCASCPSDPDGGLQEANAHLIAAAPDLYEAVMCLMTCEDPHHVSDAHSRAKDALAKAKGET